MFELIFESFLYSPVYRIICSLTVGAVAPVAALYLLGKI